MIRRIWAVAAALTVLSPLPSSAATCGAGYGDLNLDELVDVVDLQCIVTVVLAQLDAEAMMPECLGGPLIDADMNGNGIVNISDAVIVAALALELPLPPSIDANSTNCADALEVVCGDGTCDEVLGEDCLSCGFDCGACPDPCCGAHDSAGCAEPEVESCVCDISSFCCDFLWDQSCVELALEFCEPTCGGGSCPTTGLITCGQTVVGTTVGGAESFTDYSCAGGDVSGPERVYGFFAPSDSGFEATVTATDGGNFSLRVLDDSCETAGCIAGGSATSAATATTAGQFYYLVVDGAAAGAGAFELTLECADECDVPTLCADLECGSVTCGGVSFECGTCADNQTCSSGACLDFEPSPGCAAASGDCFSPKESTGCNDPVCCTTVCAIDPFCCDSSWDSICVETALGVCGSDPGDPGDPGDPPTGECVGFCDTSAPSGCYCDSACVGFGDCCPDACATCGYCF